MNHRDMILIKVNKDDWDGDTSITTYSVVHYAQGIDNMPTCYIYTSQTPEEAQGVREFLLCNLKDELFDAFIADLPKRLPWLIRPDCISKIQKRRQKILDKYGYDNYLDGFENAVELLTHPRKLTR